MAQATIESQTFHTLTLIGRGRLLRFNGGNQKVQHADGTQPIVGVSLHDITQAQLDLPEDDEREVTVALIDAGGIANVEAGVPITPGDKIHADSVGRGTNVAGTITTAGIALTAAAQVGDFFEMLFLRDAP